MTEIRIDAAAAGTPYDPFWKRMVCGDRSGLALRADYRACLARAVRECGFETLRQHGLFHDDMFVWPAEDDPLNFQYVFSNFDAYLSIGLRPFVELSFIPSWMASNDNTVFAVKCAACPPKDHDHWRRLVGETVRACVDRYGLDEVRSWNFEVWNEANIGFFKGTQEQYFELYRHAVDAVKSVDASLRVGGPATSNYHADDQGVFRPIWVEDMIAFCDREKLPLDFISTHPYPTNFPFDDETTTYKRVFRERDATTTDLKLLRKMVDESPFPHAAIHANEWGTSPGVRDRVHDHPFSATFHCENLLSSIGLVDSMARWVFCDVSEEKTPGPAEFHGGWGLLTVHGIAKPCFHAYRYLNRLGGAMLYNDGDGCAVARSAGAWQVLLYNHHHYAEPGGDTETLDGVEATIGTGAARSFDLRLEGLPPRVRLRRHRVDREHAWPVPVWQEMGAPAWPTPAQIDALHDASEPDVTSEVVDTENGVLALSETLPELGMEFIEIEKV